MWAVVKICWTLFWVSSVGGNKEHAGTSKLRGHHENVIHASNEKADAEEARWLVEATEWGVLSYMSNIKEEAEHPTSTILSHADVDGMIYFYLMKSHDDSSPLTSKGLPIPVSYTLSEASLPPFENFALGACGQDGTLDAEDPRCAKLTIQGLLQPCTSAESCKNGEAAMFEKHPDMKSWPEDHHFAVYELLLHDIVSSLSMRTCMERKKQRFL